MSIPVRLFGKLPQGSVSSGFLNAIDPCEVDHLLGMWIRSFGLDDDIAIDGKTMRGTSKKKTEQTHVLSVVTDQEGLQLTQKKLIQQPMRSHVFDPYSMR